MSSCKNFPDTDNIYILDSNPDSKVFECKKKTNDGKTKYICNGNIDDGFWKLEKGENDNCRWWRCKTPFKRNSDGTPVLINGKVDNSDFSDCTITNFPYYIKNENELCSVHNVFTGETVEKECRTDKSKNTNKCCTAGEICDSGDCLKYKALDKYLISTSLNYKCNGGYCEETSPGKGDYTNPFCDYQCLTDEYPKNYTCINGYCQQVSDPENYKINCEKDDDCGKGNTCKDKKCSLNFYNNPYCDTVCNIPDNTSFNCETDSNGVKKCKIVQDKSGKYSNEEDCINDCSSGSNNNYNNYNNDNTNDNSNKMINTGTLIIYIVIIIANIVLIYSIVFLINKAFRKQ